MKFTAAFVSLVLSVAVAVEAHPHINKGHYRRGPSATFVEPTPTPTPAPAPAPPSNPGSKRAVPYNANDAPKAFGSKVSKAYNWDSAPGGTIPGKEFVPMLWSNRDDHTRNWVQNANAAIAAGATHLLGFNEADLGDQANMSPQVAAEAWMTYMQPFAGKAKLVSPAVTNGPRPNMGLGWMDQFLQACQAKGCTIDAIAIHIYDSATNVGYFQNYITEVVDTYKKPVWVTEYGASGTEEQKEAFVRTMVPWLESNPGIEMHAYFMAGQNILTDGSNQLTALGRVYDSV